VRIVCNEPRDIHEQGLQLDD